MSRKERQLQQRRMVKRLLIVWGILGIIGFVWLVYTIISWLAGLFTGAPDQTPASGDYLKHAWTQEDALQDGTGDSGFIYVEPEKIVSREVCLELYEDNRELLVLVNREHA